MASDLVLQPSVTGGLTPTQRATANFELVRVLGPVVKAKHVETIQGRAYLKVAGCQAIASGLGYTTGTLSVDFVEEAGSLPAHWKATVGVYDAISGHMVAKGTSAVFLTEARWKKADHFACMGMAQTRATGRALKGVMGWAFSMLDVEGSFLEEMPADGPTTPQEAPEAPRRLPAPSKAAAAPEASSRVERAIAGKTFSKDADQTYTGRVAQVYENNYPKPHKIVLEDGTVLKAWNKEHITAQLNALIVGEEYRFFYEVKKGKPPHGDDMFLTGKMFEVAKPADEVPF